ncbi:Basic-leucine zipper (bZIP) transcription factor family protein [Trifolium repens]|nr:Basic-leucine zipper (bZIP) transcription factor family protein [Trifolium repens]
MRNYSQEHASLPPKISKYEINESCLEGLMSELGKECGLRRHHRTYSDSMLSEQQQQQQQQEVPYWLKDLLDDDDNDNDEPEESEEKLKPSTNVCSSSNNSRTHRRSSSDSLAYLHNKTILQYSPERKEQNTMYIVAADQQPSFLHQNHPRTDHSKRGKRHSAQQYRARKVQYIGELERSIQALQAEGYEVSAELEFLDQQNLILGMENRALKQRLDSLSQEHFVKCLEQEVLEREITRLRNLYQQQQHKQQQQQQQQKHHGRNRSKQRQDLDSSIAKLSLKNKGTESSQKAR